MAPLSGVRVVDLSRLLPGPYASLLLADLGADVLKVEDPEAGDYLRNLPPLVDEASGGGMFAALNRGKRSLVLDLKAPGGPALLRRLLAGADVLLEGFRPGVLEKFGLGPAHLCAEFPRLVVCSITGYGRTGPWKDRAGHDIGYLALAGVLARCGDSPARAPALPGVQLADVMGGGQTAVMAILAALFERERTGRGRALDVSMTEGAMGFVLPHLGALAAGQPPQARGEDVLSGSHPCYRVYLCGPDASGARGALAVGALEPKFWQRLCAGLERPEWADRQFERELVPEVDALFATRTRDEWAARLMPFDCCTEPVLEPHEVAAHPQHVARGLFVESGALRLLRAQPALAAEGELPRGPAPSQGQHTEEVLRELGVGPAELEALRAAGVVPR